MTAILKKYTGREYLTAIFNGRIYPLFICTTVAVGSIFEIELYLAALHTALAIAALLVSNSIKPVLVSIMTFVMQISVGHAPYYPTYSDYFFTGWRVYLVAAMAVSVLLAFSLFILKNRIYKKINFRDTPFLAPLVPLLFAFLLNGAFSGGWTPRDLCPGLLNAFVFCGLPILFYHGLPEENSPRELAKYFSYISMLTAAVVIAELSALFIRGGKIFEGGAINKVEVALGWGIWNLVGITLAILIPVIFYGVHRSKYPWLYFAVATAAYLFAILTMSRNALLFGSIGYISCFIISCFFGKLRYSFRGLALLLLSALVAAALLFKGEIYTLLSDYFERGFSDNGRFALWRAAFENFLKAPLFGSGFLSFTVDDSLLYPFGPLAKQAHNTVLQLLSATGVFGLFAYVYYRYSTLRTLLRRPSLESTFMGISIGALLLSSLLDNFIFNIYPMHFYTVALVIVYKSAGQE